MAIKQTCTIAELTPLNDTTYWLTLEVGKLVEQHGLHAGQFLHIACGEGLLLRRPVSVATAHMDEPEDLAALIFEVRGEGTKWLSERKTGDKLDVLGPLGNGFEMNSEGRYLLVGGGIGVPPLLGYGEYGRERTTAVLGFRSADRVILEDRFKECCKDVLLCTDDGSKGHHGFVDELVRRELDRERYAGVLACGPKPMLKAVAAAAREHNVPCQVSMEERMGCGVGACLVCACRMKDGRMRHVCKDGPVFDAGEVDWDA